MIAWYSSEKPYKYVLLNPTLLWVAWLTLWNVPWSLDLVQNDVLIPWLHINLGCIWFYKPYEWLPLVLQTWDWFEWPVQYLRSTLCRLFLSTTLQLAQYYSSKHYRAQHSILTCCHREWSSLQDEVFSHQTTHGQEVQPEVSLLQTDSDEGISLQGTHISSPGAPFLRATLASSRKVRGRQRTLFKARHK